MATNLREKAENTGNAGLGLLKTAIGVSPLFAAAYMGGISLKANEAINLPIAKSTPIQELGRKIGATAKAVSLKQKALDEARAKESLDQIKIHLDKAESLQEIFRSTERRNSLLQALALTLDDPALGLEDNKRMMMKQQLLEAANISTPEHETVVRDVMRAISDSADNNVASKFLSLQAQFSNVGGQLNAPQMEIPRSGVVFNPVAYKKLSELEKDYVKQIRDALGGDFDVQVQKYSEFGRDFRVAQVFKRGSTGDRFKTNIPLLSYDPRTGVGTGPQYFRSGQSGRTLYAMPRRMGDLEKLYGLAEKGVSKQRLREEMVRTPEYFVNELARRAGAGFVDFADYNSWMTSHMTNVDRVAGTGTAFASHSRFQAEAKMATVGLYNISRLTPEQQRKAVATIGSRFPGMFDPGIGGKRILSRSEEGLMGSMGIHKGSFFDTLQQVYGWTTSSGSSIDRTIVPLTMREHQIVGRSGMFAGPTYSIGKSGLAGGSVFKAALAQAQGNDHEALRAALRNVTPFGELVSGGLGSVVLMDVSKKGRLTQGAGGSGMAYTGRSQLVETPHQFAVLDPKTHGYLESDILRRLQAAGSAGISLTKEELRQGLYLGETSGGSKFLPFNERMTGMHLRLGEVTEDAVAGGTRRTVSVIAQVQKDLDIFKVFGLSHKGNVEVVDNLIGQLESEAQTPIRQAFKTLGIDEASAIFAPSDMMSKGAIGFMNQIGGGSRVVSQGGITLDELKSRASRVAGRSKPIFDIFRDPKKPVEVEYKALAHYAQAAMELMYIKKVDPALIGLVMSGVYHGAEGDSSKYGLNKASIDTLARVMWRKSPDKLKAFQDALGIQKALAYDVSVLGESVNDWARGRAGVEPRFAKTLQERLLGFGLDMDTASGIVSGIYKNKIGIGQHFNLATQLLDMQTYASGATTARNFVSDGQKTRLSYNDLIQKILGEDNKENSLVEYLKKTKGGVVLDLTDAPSAISQAAKDVFRQGELFLPGQEAFEAARGTTIKQAEGGSALVESELGQVIESLQGRLYAFSKDTKAARESLTEWKTKSQNLFLRVFDQLNAGKIKGGISPTAGLYDLTMGTGVLSKDARMLNRARDVFFKSRGQAVFQSAEGFLSQLHDMRGTEDTSALARKARMFFTSMERGGVGSRYLGIAGIGGRHPMMTTGNVFMTQTFRHLEEVTALGGQDMFFERLKGSELGKAMLQEHFKTTDVKSFAHMATFGKSQQKSFFKQLVENINHFSSGQSSDMLYVPGLKTTHGDLGIGVQAFTDQDGDHTLHFLLDSPSANRVMKQLRSNGDAYALQDFKLRAFFNEMGKQTKGALGNMAQAAGERMGAMGVEQKLFQDVMKEVGLSMQTGPLDVSLRGLHESFLAYEQDPLQKAYARMFLGNIQENFVIKSKKLPTYENLAEQVQSAAHRLTTTGQGDELRGLLQRIFQGTDLGRGGMKVGATVGLDGGDAELKAHFDKFFGTRTVEAQYSLDEFINRAEQHVNRALSEGTLDKTTGQWAAEFGEDPVRAAMNILAGKNMGSASLEGFQGASLGAKTGVAVDSLLQGFSKIDSHMTGRLALGALASAGLYGMMTGGVSPEPIIMPGESPSGRVMSDIASGNLFSRRDPEVSPEQMIAPNNQYDRMVPINTGTTYAVRPNSYQIRGEVSSGSGLATFGSYFNQLTGGNGRGVITINDQRRPITRNYVDRLLGEY